MISFAIFSLFVVHCQNPAQLNYIEVEFSDEKPQLKRDPPSSCTNYTQVVSDKGKVVLVSEDKHHVAT